MLQRKLEKELALYGGAPPATDSAPSGSEESNEEDEDSEPIASVSGIFVHPIHCVKNIFGTSLCSFHYSTSLQLFAGLGQVTWVARPTCQITLTLALSMMVYGTFCIPNGNHSG